MTLLISAIPTPFLPGDKGVDVDALRELCERLREAGVDGVFAAGTMGEFVGLTDEERLTVFRTALDVFGPERVWAHVGAATAGQAHRLALEAVLELGARNLAAITPYYGECGPEGLDDYIASVAAAAAAGEARLFGYLFRERTGYDVDPDMFLSIAIDRGLAGVKISGEPAARIGDFVRERQRYTATMGELTDFRIYTGHDAGWPQAHRLGADGVVSGTSALIPGPFVDLAAALRRNDEVAAAAAQRKVARAVAATGGGDIALIKAAMSARKLSTGGVRVPFETPTGEGVKALLAVLDELG